MKKFFVITIILFVNIAIKAQGGDCNTAEGFCTGTTYTFPASTTTTAQTGPNYGCLGSQPNPAWYYLQIANSGNLVLDISQTDASGVGQDVDFICWGPFTSPSAGCASGLTSSAVDCSFSAAATETCTIPNAVTGEFYILLLTNYSGQPADITFGQSSGTGSTNCNILCSMSGLTAVPGACNPATNTFAVTGVINYSDPPTSGTLTVTNTCSGVTQVFNAPFAATSVSYSLAGLPSNGGTCSVTATFSGDPLCTFTTNFTAPAPCTVNCGITAITAVPTVCNVATQQYDVSGNITFVNAPATGTLTISNSCGGTPVVLNVPFTSPAAYSFTGLSANSAACNITATFSANVACTLTQAYTAPAPCPVSCSITSLTATPTTCNIATQQYDVSGSSTFVNAPTSGTLTFTNSCGGTPVVLNAPFTSPVAYTFTGLSANSAACNITAAFSANVTCTLTQAYTAPAPCPVSCSITTLTATPSACDPLTNNYIVTGNISFVNPPSSGTLTVSSSSGGSPQIFNAPFVSPYTYSLGGLTSDAATGIVTAVFSANTACTLTQTYIAPASCSSCPVTAGNNGPFCPGQTLNLTATSVVNATYSWTGPNGFTSALQNPILTNVTSAMNGNYTVSVNVASPLCNSSSITNVVVNPNPVVTVNSPTTCIGVSATITATGAATYVWSTTETTSAITVPGTTATYTVIGTTNGCTGTAVSTVTTTPLPIVNFSADKLNGCNPISVVFTANTAGNTGATYNWDFGDGTTGTGASSSHFYTSNWCHTVILTVSFAANCSTKDSIPCMIDVSPQPDANFLISPSEIDILNPTAFFTNMSTSSSIWVWNFGDTTFSSSQNPEHAYPQIGTFPVTLYSSNSDGCIDSITYFVLINDVLTVYVPNAFTPNGNGVNDIFNIYSHGIDSKDFELLIFDRWGNKIFKTNDLYEGWNGAINNHGDVVQEDVYVYHVNYRDLKGRKKKLIGHVSMVK
ncbi:MAG: hypothetical protein A3F72_14975 [Bacteroidetes bacterium RIFCSPLOWO2_12_FULL_35_15]|nr:MAG: hypothetical protein A3F72_14975 [Bacteroidetes bacterium RIFCSPLOWO2_12_FULL_35_15]